MANSNKEIDTIGHGGTYSTPKLLPRRMIPYIIISPELII